MEIPRGRAIIAGGAPGLADALEAAGLELRGRAANAADALRLLREARPDLIALDAILPGMDGAAFARAVRREKLNRQPGLLLMKPRGLKLPGEASLPNLGAMALETPTDRDALVRAIRQALALDIPLPAEKAARLDGLLDALGVPEHPGRTCLKRAVTLAWADRRRLNALKACLYPEAARLCAMTPEQCERAIRHVIDRAFRTGEIERQHEIFGDTIDARRGKPTGGEMIAQLADILRWEG